MRKVESSVRLRMPAEETAALMESWLDWLPYFIRQETGNSADAGAVLERAFILATIRAGHDVYKKMPGEEEMGRGTSLLARKLNHFYGLARDMYLKVSAGGGLAASAKPQRVADGRRGRERRRQERTTFSYTSPGYLTSISEPAPAAGAPKGVAS